MLSYQDQYELTQDILSDGDATNLTLIKSLIRQGQVSLEGILNIDYTVNSRNFTTVTDAISGTSNRAYPLPERFRRVVSLYVTVGTTRYSGEQIFDEDLWQTINTDTGQISNYLQHFFIRGARTIELFPIPSSACTATMIYQETSKILSADNYVTGTILTLTNGAKAITGTDTVFTAAMVGRYFKIDDDAVWYKIAGYTSATAITLDTNYQGTSIAAGTSAYTIGEFPITPPDTHILPVYYACWKYQLFRKNVNLAREFERQWKEGVLDAQANYASSNASHILENKPLGFRGGINPNFYPTGLT